MNIQNDEYGEFYAGYIVRCYERPLMELLVTGRENVISLIESVSEEESFYRYDTGKWSVKEVLGHMIDTERIFSFRALALARGEKPELPGYDHNQYVIEADFNRHSLKNLVQQYRLVREATMALFSNFSEEELLRKGRVNQSGFSVRGLGYVIAGHELHHISILKEYYLPGINQS